VPPLTICLASEPETLFLYGGNSLAQNHVLQAIYDGPIDTQNYGYQPVILEKLPDLADGDAVIEPVAVEVGDWIVNADGERVHLAVGERVRPSGCESQDCTIAWDGSPLELAQLSATYILKEGLAWSDGEALTAGDSVFSYQVAKDCRLEGVPCGGLGLPGKQGAATLERTAEYTALDERRVRWSGLPGFMDPGYQANFFSPLPEHQLAGIPADQLFSNPQAAQEPPGWGPYAIEDGQLATRSASCAIPVIPPAEDLPALTGGIPLCRTGFEQAWNSSYEMCDVIDQEASQAARRRYRQPVGRGG
jgi:peptide/nickel transport system substrate-binding protein